MCKCGCKWCIGAKLSILGAIGIVIGFMSIVIGIIGWVLNIIHLAHSHVITGMVILRAIGIVVAPLGCVLGWF